jgi:ADP-dependent NAD(P)H-hydrate dehydratase / NAD(P)H-hydrate epimerase
MRILTSDEVRQVEREAAARPGLSTKVLLKRAGAAVAQFCAAHFKFSSVCVVCGKGNNGGAGLAAAEVLSGIADGVSVIILAAGPNELSPDCAAMGSGLQFQPIWVSDEPALDSDAVREALSADLVIDAVLGAGFKPPLRGLPQRVIAAINDALGTVVSVDLPSGVEPSLARPAHETGADMVFAHGIITFIAPKPAHVFGELTSGPIAVSEIGAQPALVPNETKLNAITGQEVAIAFPPRSRDANKGHFGHVLVVAGSVGKPGAAALAGIAALSTGAGLVTVACPQSIQATVAGFAPELMTEGLPETGEGSIATAASVKVDQILSGKDAVVLGPGLSRHPETEEFVRRLVERCPLPLVLDADGLNAFDGYYALLKPRDERLLYRVLTPHPGEAARLLGISTKEIQADRVEIAKRIARDTGSCAVLKGWRTIVAGFSDETWINMTGNPALAKGGSGDVLSGMIGAALARHSAGLKVRQPVTPAVSETVASSLETGGESRNQIKEYQERRLKLNSAQAAAFLSDTRVAAAVHLHGLAADLARDRFHENTVLATQLAQCLAPAFRECEWEMDRSLFSLQK